jgi:hypothetical protein
VIALDVPGLHTDLLLARHVPFPEADVGSILPNRFSTT